MDQYAARLSKTIILLILFLSLVIPSMRTFANLGRPAAWIDSSNTRSIRLTPAPTYQSCGLYCKERDEETPRPVLTDTAIPVLTSESPASLNSGQSITTIYFFWGDGCPHCAAAKPFLEELSGRYDGVKLRAFEIYQNEDNQASFEALAAVFHFEPRYVPTMFIGDQYWEGYNAQYEDQIEAKVLFCVQNGCPDKGMGIIPGDAVTTDPTGAPVASSPTLASASEPDAPDGPTSEFAIPQSLIETDHRDMLTLPFIGSIDLSRQPLLVSTLLISFVDGFNPCSIWVLTMLLAITLHSGSRKKIVIVGIIFITVTAVVYALFIAGLFTVLTVMSFAGWIHAVVAFVALLFAAVNIKDYFWYKEGISFTIDDQQKPALYKRMRRVMDAGDSMWALTAGTVVLAAGVSLVEFACTAGFPVLWTNMMASQGVTAGMFLFLLLVYMLVYQLDELVIFFAAVLTMRRAKMEEKHGRILKLVSGMLMLTLAFVMLVNPNIMNTLSGSLTVFAVTFAGIAIVLVMHRLVLPAAGIQLGTEFQASKKQKHHTRKA